MSADELDTLLGHLNLDRLPAGATSQTTFLPLADTLASVPKDELRPTDSAMLGTLPKLQLSSPDAARTSSDEPDLLPIEVLGEGGMGQVLLAQQTALGRKVAVKVLKPQLANRAAADALVQEARTAGGLEHPGVVPIYALARDAQGLPAVVMKRVEGLSWRELMHSPQHPAWAKLVPSGEDRLAFHIEVLVQVCNAVAHAHQRSVLHRDVKPANVLLGELGEVYLADWGVAVSKGKGDGVVRLVGTPAYLAPEMVSGEASKMDERTDVYLLGATLHEVLTGEPPHLANDLRDVLLHAARAPEPSLPPGTPPMLAALCKRALAADPAKRFASATALRDALKRYLQHRGSTALAEASAARLAELEAMPAQLSGPHDERRWYALVFECRFGFTQALKDSPDHDEARDGLRRCLEVAVRHEIARGAAAAARAFFSELEAPPADLKSSLEVLEAAEAQRAQDSLHLRRLTHDLDPQVSARQRSRLILSLAGAVLAMAIFFGIGPTSADIAERYRGWFRLIPLSIVGAAYIIAVIIGRRSLFSTRINRELLALIGVGTFGTWVHRFFGILVGLSVPATMVEDAIFLCAIVTFGALSYHRGFLLSALIFFCTAIACWLMPQHSLAVFGFGSAIAVASFAVVFRLWRRDLVHGES
jgi:serine/threonine protein kinase